jgi:adenine-specific DNA-methyltransferase
MPLLHWLTRDEDIHRAAQAQYRLLEEAPELSYGNQRDENILIHGDNLDALKALLPYYAGKVKCIYIDPPYNTKSAFEHYDDNLEHSQWLATMYPRIELLRNLLSENGSIWVSIDDNEGHYLKVILDEIFGRSNFVANVIWQKLYTVKNSAKYLSDMHDHILVYAKSKLHWLPNLLPRTDKSSGDYSNPDKDLRGPWTTNAIQARNYYSLGTYEIVSPAGRVHLPPTGTYWRISKETFEQLNADNRIWWGKTGNAIPRIKKFLSEAKTGIVPATLWLHTSAGTNAEAKQEVRDLIGEGGEIFLTPKPEKLLKLVLTIASKPGDLVLDSFLGSGTTAAVAHKMGRRYIGVEMGTHAMTHCAPRLKKVIEGEQGGISKDLGWKGGGGFRFYRLGDAVFDEMGRVSPGIRFGPLAAHVWFVETGVPFSGRANSPFLGNHKGTGYYLLYNGVLGDKRPNGGNVLTSKILAQIQPFDGPKIIFGEGSRLSPERLKKERITFRQIPYEIKAR